MREDLKVYIKGVRGRGEEVKQALINLGGYVVRDYNYTVSDCLYYINHNEEIRCTEKTTEIGKIIMDNYKEIKLPEKWKDGDLLVYTNDNGTTHYAVYKETEEFNEYTQPHSMLAYISVNKHIYGINTIIFKDGWKLASDEEYKEFYELLHKHGVDWDAEKKQVVDWRWKPKFNEKYWIVTTTLDVNFFIWKESPTDIQMLDSGNCFKTKEDAKITAKKIKDLLKMK